MRFCNYTSMLTSALIALGTGSALAEDGSRLSPLPINVNNLPTMHITIHGRNRPPTVEWQAAPAEGGIAGCQALVSRTDANFSGGSFHVQAGFSEQEIAACSYVIPAGEFPIKVDLFEFIFGTQNATVQTTTQYSVLFWDGPPNTGTLVAQFSSDNSGTELPPIVLGPGTTGVNVNVSIDPGDPEQIFMFDSSGTHTFSCGVRIDHHNNQTANPCTTAPPSNSNAFPCTDTGGLNFASFNWLNGLNCGAFGCPANGGWSTFAALPVFCRPSGDWVMRATYSQVNCQVGVGACCLPDGTCEIRLSQDCTGSGYTFNGDGSNCDSPNCVVHSGACCLPSGACEIRFVGDCTGAGTIYRGDGTTCATANCPQPTGACCFQSTGGCVNLTQVNCAGAAGIYHGDGTACATTVCFPIGACCKPDGSCLSNVSPETCTGQGGNFQGNQSTCAAANCPLPPGACCFSNGFCLDLTNPDCTSAGATWRGMGTACSQSNVCVTSPCLLGDANCDGSVNNFDIDPFVVAIINPDLATAPAAYLASGGTQACWDARTCWGDVSHDSAFNNFDIDPFVECIVLSPPAGQPCP